MPKIAPYFFALLFNDLQMTLDVRPMVDTGDASSRDNARTPR